MPTTALVFLLLVAAGCGGGGVVGGSGGSSGGGSGGRAGGTGGSGDAGRPDGNRDVGAQETSADAPGDEKAADAGGRDTYVVERGPDATGILIHVANGCSFDLFIRGEGSGVVLQPDGLRLPTGEAHDYLAPDVWAAARVTAYLGVPPQDQIDKVEMTLEKKIDTGTLQKVLNYNITYVDWLGLPIEIVGIGTGGDCKRVGCYVPEAQVLTGCPDGLLSGKRCLSAGTFCSDPGKRATPFCHALDTTTATCAQDAQKYPGCAGAAGVTTPNVYSCAGGFFSQQPKWCAALNRGVIDDPENGDIAAYYQKAPYNTYSKWVHATCPGIYAFPYDDYGKTNESGFHSCVGGTQLNITFCPSG
ncbi:MAG TPA: beta-1,3-glucanase family protein [Polyangia bacterium]|nr:beta-1,3-glucanase family protein [Polyangia bacterium]